jgi:hypothetical protein
MSLINDHAVDVIGKVPANQGICTGDLNHGIRVIVWVLLPDDGNIIRSVFVESLGRLPDEHGVRGDEHNAHLALVHALCDVDGQLSLTISGRSVYQVGPMRLPVLPQHRNGAFLVVS